MIKTILAGIGILALLVPFLEKEKKQKTNGNELEKPPTKPPQPTQPAPVTKDLIVGRFYTIPKLLGERVPVFETPNGHIIDWISPLIFIELQALDKKLDHQGFWWGLFDIAYNGSLVVYKRGWIRSDYVELLPQIYQAKYLIMG